MSKPHHYKLTVQWTGNRGTGTSDYKAFERSHTVSVNGKTDILCSSDPLFRGDSTKHNPEELLLASVSACHMLWYLHLCAAAGVVVTNYTDEATATMQEEENGSGKFTGITLHPTITLAHGSMKEKADELHKKANEMCFIANSLNFPVYHQPIYLSGKN